MSVTPSRLWAVVVQQPSDGDGAGVFTPPKGGWSQMSSWFHKKEQARALGALYIGTGLAWRLISITAEDP